MFKLLAIIPEDGWSLVSSGKTIILLWPPFGSSERVQVSEEMLADAIALHGYDPKSNMPEESWAHVIERIREIMCSVRAPEDIPPDHELLARMLRSGPVSVLTGLLDRIEEGLFLNFPAAEQALKALLAEDRVKSSPGLLSRALALRQKIDTKIQQGTP